MHEIILFIWHTQAQTRACSISLKLFSPSQKDSEEEIWHELEAKAGLDSEVWNASEELWN